MRESKRKIFTELPEVKELERIIEREEDRPPAEGKEGEHFAEFDLAVRWLDLVELPSDIFSESTSWQETLVTGNELQEEVVSKTLRLVEQGDNDTAELMGRVTEYLGEEDKPERSDLIFVFGSKNKPRIQKAFELYEQGLAPTIFITGGNPIYEDREKPEADILKEWAVEQGIPKDRIITHNTAITIADNVRGGLNALDAEDIPRDSIILITAWFAMKRSWAMMMKYVPQETRLVRVGAEPTQSGNFTKEGWWRNEVGLKTIFNEFTKLRVSEGLNTS